MRFENGDIVKIAKTSEFYENRGSNNPKDVEGVLRLDRTNYNYAYKVNWGEGRGAWYNDKDLRLVRRQ